MITRFRLLSASALVVLALAVPATPAGAHAEIRESNPPADGTAPTGREEITMTFITMDSDVPPQIEVEGPDGTSVVSGDPTIAETSATGTTVVVPVAPLEEGPHRVSWRAMSSDGDGLSTGTYGFDAEDSPGSGPGVWLLWIVVLAVPALIFLRPGSRRRTHDEPQI